MSHTSSVFRLVKRPFPGNAALARVVTRLDRGDDFGAYRAALADSVYRREAGGHLLERLGEWAYTIGMIVLAYELTGSVAAVAALVLAHVAPRLLLLTAGATYQFHNPRVALLGGNLARALLVLALLFVSARGDLWWAVLVALGLGSLSAVTDTARVALLPALVPRPRLVTINMLTGRIEQFCLLAGSLLTALVMLAWDTRATFVLAALTVSASVAVRVRLRPVTYGAATDQPRPVRGSSWHALRGDSTQSMLLAGLFAGAVLGMSLRVLLIDVVVSRHGYSEALYAGLLAVVGIGALAGPIPISRLLGKLPASMVAFAIVLTLAIGGALVGLADMFLIVAPVLFLSGVLAITNDLATATAARRLAHADQLAGTFSILAAAVVAGQIVALLVVLGLTPWLEAREVLLAASAGCALAVSVVWLRIGRVPMATSSRSVAGARR